MNYCSYKIPLQTEKLPIVYKIALSYLIVTIIHCKTVKAFGFLYMQQQIVQMS